MLTVILALLPCSRVPIPSPDSTVYAVLMFGHRAGQQTVWHASAADWRATFSYNDRGRGPSLTTHIQLNGNGTPAELETTGTDYLKNPVAEHFTLTGAEARWTNAAEAGAKTSPGPAFYSSFDELPLESALMARALLRAPNHSLDILPQGRAHLERLQSIPVQGAEGQRVVTLYLITGLGFTPASIVLDEHNEFYASGSSWTMVIRAGYEQTAPAVLKLMANAASSRQRNWASRLTHRHRGAIAITGVTVFDAESGTNVPDQMVVISGNRISAVGPSKSFKAPPGALIVAGHGKTLLPGLWDMHVHIGDDDGIMQLAAGVTMVRDMANDTDELLARRRRFDAGTLLGPRVILAGFMDGPGPYAGPTKVLVSTAEEVRAAVNHYADLGYVQIKMYSSVKPELVPVIIEAAHARGLRVSGHIPAYMTAEQLVRMGSDEIQHANMLFLNFWGDSIKETMTPLRFTAVARNAAGLDLSSEPVRRFIQLLADHQTVVDPTVNVFENMFEARKGQTEPGMTAVAERMPVSVQRGFLGGGLPVPEGMDQRYRDSFQAMLRMVKLLYDAGVPLVAGTDALPGFAYQRELELYCSAGIPNAAVLQIATLKAAKIMKRDGELGSVAVGKLADLILVDGNPLERMSDIRKVSLVVKNGAMYRPAELLRAIGVKP